MATTTPHLATVVVITCSCGLYPLDRATHRTARAAWEAAAAHVALNPGKCHPRMRRATVPVALG